MSLSRKHYRKIAEIFNRQLDKHGQTVPIDELASEIADMLKGDNSAFRYDKFFRACGLDQYGYVPKYGPMTMKTMTLRKVGEPHPAFEERVIPSP